MSEYEQRFWDQLQSKNATRRNATRMLKLKLHDKVANAVKTLLYQWQQQRRPSERRLCRVPQRRRHEGEANVALHSSNYNISISGLDFGFSFHFDACSCSSSYLWVIMDWILKNKISNHITAKVVSALFWQRNKEALIKEYRLHGNISSLSRSTQLLAGWLSVSWLSVCLRRHFKLWAQIALSATKVSHSRAARHN